MILPSLAFDRIAVADGQWWRLLTASAAHLSALHLIGNVLILVWLGWLCVRLTGSRVREVVAVALVGGWIGCVALLVGSSLTWYVGASMNAWVLLGWLCLACPRVRWPVRGAGFAVMLAWCVLDLDRRVSWIGEPLAPQAHLAGLLAGAAIALALGGRTHRMAAHQMAAHQMAAHRIAAHRMAAHRMAKASKPRGSGFSAYRGLSARRGSHRPAAQSGPASVHRREARHR